MKKIDYEKSKNYDWKFDEEAIDFSVKDTPRFPLGHMDF